MGLSSVLKEDVWSSIVLTSCLDRLRFLNITSDPLTLLLPILNKCRNSLKELNLGDCGTEAAVPIGECSELEVFHAESARISDAVIASLVQCRALKKLTLSHNYQLTDAAFTGLSEGCWPEMETLDLPGCGLLSDAGFSSLARACPLLVRVYCVKRRM